MKITILQNHHMQVQKGTRLATPDEKAANPDVEQIDIWNMVFTDNRTGDVTQIAFEREARDEMVRQMSSGIVLAPAGIPKPPKTI